MVECEQSLYRFQLINRPHADIPLLRHKTWKTSTNGKMVLVWTVQTELPLTSIKYCKLRCCRLWRTLRNKIRLELNDLMGFKSVLWVVCHLRLIPYYDSRVIFEVESLTHSSFINKFDKFRIQTLMKPSQFPLIFVRSALSAAIFNVNI